MSDCLSVKHYMFLFLLIFVLLPLVSMCPALLDAVSDISLFCPTVNSLSYLWAESVSFPAVDRPWMQRKLDESPVAQYLIPGPETEDCVNWWQTPIHWFKWDDDDVDDDDDVAGIIMMMMMIVGHGGALVEAITLNRRVVGSTPALAAM